ncbi:MAG: glycosyltransferase family 4 protein, partial [Acidobacteriota bacterium]
MTTTNRRIKVLDLRDTHEVGGPGKTILETFKAIDASRFDLHLGIYLVKGESTDTPFVRAARACGLPVHFVRGQNQYDPRLIPRTAALVRAHDFDLVHAHEVKSDVLTYLSSFLHRVPIVTTVHGFIANTPKQRALVALDRWLLRRFDRVFALSGRLRDELVQHGVPAAKVVLVHNGLVLTNYQRTGTRGGLAALAGRELPGPVIASIGRLSREKGHADLIEGLAIVAAQGHRLTTVLAGDGPER